MGRRPRQPVAEGGRTIVCTRCSSVRSGSFGSSMQRPVCTAEVWIVVLRGATSQSKRSRSESLPSAPAAAPPAQITGIVASAASSSMPA